MRGFFVFMRRASAAQNIDTPYPENPAQATSRQNGASALMLKTKAAYFIFLFQIYNSNLPHGGDSWDILRHYFAIQITMHTPPRGNSERIAP